LVDGTTKHLEKAISLSNKSVGGVTHVNDLRPKAFLAVLSFLALSRSRLFLPINAYRIIYRGKVPSFLSQMSTLIALATSRRKMHDSDNWSVGSPRNKKIPPAEAGGNAPWQGN
jgi:hypothetical protein